MIRENIKNDKMDFSKLLAVLAQPKEKPEPLKNVEFRKIEVSFINKNKEVDKALAKIYFPKDAKKPVPLIFIPHYEMGDDALELRLYLKNGWAVASPTEVKGNINAALMEDDLVYNNAALYTLRQLPEIDKSRIVLVGGSAGGYMALMLSALQLGICGTIGNGPITNVYFNSVTYSDETTRINQPAFLRFLAKQKEEAEKPKEVKQEEHPQESGEALQLQMMKGLKDFPLPFNAALSAGFAGVNDNFPDRTDMKRYEDFSPTGLAEMFCSPLMINHFCSDVLVPVDQISKKFTYDKPGDSLPEDFNMRLPENIPGKLKYSFEERIDKDKTNILRIPVSDPNEDMEIPFDLSKQFNILIYDEGPAEGYATHRTQIGTGRFDDVPYIEALMKQTAVKTNILTPEKLQLLLERYQGKSIQLPVRTGVDENVYGSLTMYQNEVCMELGEWKESNGIEALERIFEQILSSVSEDDWRQELTKTMQEIRDRI